MMLSHDFENYVSLVKNDWMKNVKYAISRKKTYFCIVTQSYFGNWNV